MGRGEVSRLADGIQPERGHVPGRPLGEYAPCRVDSSCPGWNGGHCPGNAGVHALGCPRSTAYAPGMSDHVLDQVMKAAGAEEGYEIRQFLVYRENGSALEVLVHDRGFDAPTGRYSVTLRWPDRGADERSHSGNPGRTLDEALNNAHWNQFR